MTKNEILSQCCICRYPSRTTEQLKRTSHTVCNGCLQVVYPNEYKQMVAEGCISGEQTQTL